MALPAAAAAAVAAEETVPLSATGLQTRGLGAQTAASYRRTKNEHGGGRLVRIMWLYGRLVCVCVCVCGGGGEWMTLRTHCVARVTHTHAQAGKSQTRTSEGQCT